MNVNENNSLFRYVVKITVEGIHYFQHKRELITFWPKEKVLEYFQTKYQNHTKKGSDVSIKIEQALFCGEYYEVL